MSQLKQIQAPIAREMQEFDTFYKRAVSSEHRMLNLFLRYTLFRKGKRIRPMLVFLAAAACAGTTEESMIAAAMVELVHNASLLHDDVVDQGDMRRGYPTLRRLWKSKGTVLTGDYMLAQGLNLAVKHKAYELLEVMNHATQQMSNGEIKQLQRMRKQKIDEAGYYEVIGFKTSMLLSVCCECGAKTGKADETEQQALKDYGLLLGNAFQIRDDILDFTRVSLIGKSTGNDIKEGKLTLPIIFALQSLSDTQARKKKMRLLRRARHDHQAWEEAIQFVKKSGALKQAANQVAYFTQMAKEMLDPLKESQAKESLRILADHLQIRSV